MRGDFRDSVGIQFWKSARGVISPKAPGRTLSSELVELGGDARNSQNKSASGGEARWYRVSDALSTSVLRIFCF